MNTGTLLWGSLSRSAGVIPAAPFYSPFPQCHVSHVIATTYKNYGTLLISYCLLFLVLIQLSCLAHRQLIQRQVTEAQLLLKRWNHNNKYRIFLNSIVFIPPPGWGNKQNRMDQHSVFTFSEVQSPWLRVMEKSVRNSISIQIFSSTVLNKNLGLCLCYCYCFWFWWAPWGGKIQKNLQIQISQWKTAWSGWINPEIPLKLTNPLSQ